MRTPQLAHEDPHGLAHGGLGEVELTSLGHRQKMLVLPCPEIAGFDPSTEGIPRQTADLDVLPIGSSEALQWLQETAGKNSKLHKRYKVWLQIVPVATLPHEYASRLLPMFPGAFSHLELLAPDPHDLALSKLQRNAHVDIEDVKYLARSVSGFDLEVLRHRYETELRPFLHGPLERADGTMKLWIDAIMEERHSPS